MKAKLLKEQMGVPAGTEMEVLETGRAWTLKAPSGAEIVVPSCDVAMVPDTEPLSEPKDQESAFDREAYLREKRELEEQGNIFYSETPFPAFDPKDPSLLVNIFGNKQEPDPIDLEPTEEEQGGQFVESVFPSDEEPERTLLDDERDAFPEPTDDDHDPKWEDSRDEASDPQPDDDLDEPLPTPQGNCEGEACESCQ